MEKKTLHYIAFAGLALGLLGTPEAHAECGIIMWSMGSAKPYIPQVKYIDCNTEEVKNSDAKYTGDVRDALVGSEINLGPAGSTSNYTPGQTVKSGINEFKCSGVFGSSGNCLRVQ